MTNEQREAIEMVEYIADNTWTTKYIMSSDSKKADAVLSLIKEQEKQIENTTENYKNLIEDISMLAKELGLEDDATIDEIYITIKRLKQKDKQIDLMAEEIIMTKPINCTKTNEFSTKKIYMSKEEIKQYFADKVKTSQ